MSDSVLEREQTPLGTLVRPAAEHPVAGVVFVHDVWGPSEHSRQFCERLAAGGFAVLELDLYRRTPGVSITDPGRFIRELSDPAVLQDVAAAVALLAGHAACRGRGIGVVGVCMGGMYALLAACCLEGLAAAAPFYGLLSYDHGLLHEAGGLDPERKPQEPLAAAESLRCPLLAFFGADDDFISGEDVEALRRSLRSSGQPSEVVVYPDAGHAFMNETRPDAHRPEVAEEAWEKLQTFLAARLG